MKTHMKMPTESAEAAYKRLTERTDYSPFTKYPVRICRTMHECQLCGSTITAGEQYYDGGYSRRAHVDCNPLMTMDEWRAKNELTATERKG